jgi:thiosulfate reductase cytochrome b subunit
MTQEARWMKVLHILPRTERVEKSQMDGRLSPLAHPLPVKIMHWIGAAAVICMILSGWAIYNASPLLPFTFPRWMTLGGWLAGGIAWHLSALWVLLADGLAYLVYGILSGHFRRDIRPPWPKIILRDLVDALRFRLAHHLGYYNGVQRLLYMGVIILICLQVVTGLAIWKPVQLRWLTDLFGGYPVARVIHLIIMALIVGFLIIHLALVALFPRTLVSMIAPLRLEPDEGPQEVGR